MMLRAFLGRVEVGEGLPARIVGAINMSPESFYAGSVARSVGEALERAGRMLEEGADIIDVGGMSTAPYRDRWVPGEVEAERVVPVVRAIKRELGATVSVDTVRASVAAAALDAGADIVNDVSSTLADDRMPSVIAEHGASALIATREDEAELRGGPLETVVWNLRRGLRRLLDAGVPEEMIVVDPGVGFYRRAGTPWYEWDSEILGGLPALWSLLRPVCVGVSRKSFIGAILGIEDPGERLIGSLAAEAVAVANGAHAVRTHNVAETAQAVRLAEKLRRGGRLRRGEKGLELLDMSRGLDASSVEALAETLGAEREGAKIMASKGSFRILVLGGVPRILALVLKQLMLAAGGELVTPKETLLSGYERVRVAVLATEKACGSAARRLESMSMPSLREKRLPEPRDLASLLRDAC